MPAFIDVSTNLVMLELDENHSRSIQCHLVDRHGRHRSLGTNSRFILSSAAHRSCHSERLPAPDANQTWAVQSRLHQVSAPTPSRTAHRLRPQSTDTIRPSLERRKLVEQPQPYRRHHRYASNHALATPLHRLFFLIQPQHIVSSHVCSLASLLGSHFWGQIPS